MTFEIYEAQVDLLLEVLPVVEKHRIFAIKGGTALNLFCLDMPRLSVDIDLCYLPVKERKSSFKEMHGALGAIKKELEEKLALEVHTTKPLDGEKEVRLVVARGKTVIKLEPNYIIRGSLFDPVRMDIAKSVEEKFEKSASALVLNASDLYGGKFCAALDRQHPRDLFDVHKFFQGNEISQAVKDAFLYYLLSHNRPVHELLDAHSLQLEESFEGEFRGMTQEEVALSDLEAARVQLKSGLLAALGDQDKKLLLSFAKNAPDWNCYSYPKIKNYPSIKWKLFNQGKTDRGKREAQAQKLAEILAN